MRFLFLGDSLRQENGEETYPQEGWPRARKNFYPGIDILNFAKNGRSSKSFLDEGRFSFALSKAREGDICFIGFGHNDEKKEDPSRYTDSFTTFEQNLTYRVEERKKKKVTCILLTPITRLRYSSDGILLHTHLSYPAAIKEVAEKKKVHLIDLEKRTYGYFSKRSQEENEEFFRRLKPKEYKNYPEGKVDHTHLRRKGARLVCEMVKKKRDEFQLRKK